MILLATAFAAGILTVLSPCVLPVIPLFAGAVAGRPRRLGWVLSGFALTFVAVTIILASAFAAAGFTTSAARTAAAVVLAFAGAALVIPAVSVWSERAFTPIATMAGRRATLDRAVEPAQGLLLGGLIGLVWAPCVGPIMAVVIASAAVSGPTVGSLSVAIAYVAGTAFTVGLIFATGDRLIRLVGPTRRRRLRQGAGVAMLVSAALVATGLDLSIQGQLAGIVPDGSPSASSTVEAGTADGIGGGRPMPALEDLGRAPEFTGITDWINSPPLTMDSLRGKVVLVHFWTFGCINCIHVQPYVKAWADRYAPEGLVVVGVHTPELSFERDLANVKQAVADDRVGFPVAFDPSFATWNAYANRYWPAFYFVDRHGVIRHSHFGEGDYDGSEAVIRALLAEPG